ncbi:ABC transporter permease [Nanoarchaeota archaeon]
MIKDYMKMALGTLNTRKMRSWLTMLGIFVGIAAVVALISVGQGLQYAVEQQFNEMGTDLLFIMASSATGLVPGGDENPVLLTQEDEEVIGRSKGVIMTSSWVFRSEQIDYKDEINFQFITGIPIDNNEELDLVLRMLTVDLIEGRFFEKGDKYKGVAGFLYAQKNGIFSRALSVGDKVTVNGQTIELIGIMDKIGSAPDDGQILVPIEVAEELSDVAGEPGKKTRDYIIAQVDPTDDPEKIADSVERDLRRFRDVDEGNEDFSIQTAEQLLASFNVILGVVQAILVGIAAISLLVGGIGIMNTMYTAVLERTKEIGVMKAIGARNSDVMIIFLIESGLLGVVGGIIGVIIGYGISAAVSSVTGAYLGENYMIIFFPWWLALGGVGFSFVVGAASGVMPAVQASRMNPVDALRYE